MTKSWVFLQTAGSKSVAANIWRNIKAGSEWRTVWRVFFLTTIWEVFWNKYVVQLTVFTTCLLAFDMMTVGSRNFFMHFFMSGWEMKQWQLFWYVLSWQLKQWMLCPRRSIRCSREHNFYVLWANPVLYLKNKRWIQHYRFCKLKQWRTLSILMYYPLYRKDWKRYAIIIDDVPI